MNLNHTLYEDEEEESRQIIQTHDKIKASSNTTTALSRCWMQQSSHHPFYSGGKITFCSIPTSTSSSSSSSSSNKIHSFFLTPYRGDLCIVDANTGCKVYTLRKGYMATSNTQDTSFYSTSLGDTKKKKTKYTLSNHDNQEQDDNNDDEEEEESQDVDAILQYALAPNQIDLITACRNQMIYKYNLQSILMSLVTIKKNGETTTTTNNTTTDTAITNSKKNKQKIVLGKCNHDLPITQIEFHSSSIFFATGGVDGKVKVWDSRKGSFITHSFHRIVVASSSSSNNNRGGRGSITSLQWCHDMSKLWLAIGRDDGTIQIHDLRIQYQQQQQQQQHDQKKSSLSSVSSKNSNTIDPTCIVYLSDHISAVTNMIWSPLLDTFITAGRDAVINIWSISVIVVVQSQDEQQDEVVVVGGGGMKQKQQTKKENNNKRSKKDLSTTTNMIQESKATATTTTTYRYKRIFTHPIYEQIEGMVLIPWNYINHLSSSSSSDDLSPEDMMLATVGTKGIVRLWKIMRDTHHARGGEGSDTTTPGGVGSFKDVTLWNQQSSSCAFGEKKGGYTNLLLLSNTTNECISKMSSSSSINTLVDYELLVVDAEHNISSIPLVLPSSGIAALLPLTPRRTIVGHNDEILDIKIIPSSTSSSSLNVSKNKNNNFDDEKDDGPSSSLEENQQYRIAVATNSAQVRIFDLGTFSSHTLDGHKDTVLSIDVSPCGRFLATCGKDKTMRIWFIETSTCVAIAQGHTEAIGSTAFSRRIGPYDVRGKAIKNGAGAFTVTASNDNTLKRWNLPGASDLIEKSSIIKSTVSSHGMDENNNGGSSSPVMFELRVFVSARAHDKEINIVRVAPNDSLVATGSQDKTVKIWDSNDLTLRGTLRGHKRGVWDCQFSPYDKVVATGSGDKTVKLWSLGDYSCVRTFQGHLSTVLRVRFLCGGLQLVSSGSDGLVKLWTIRTNECEGTMDGHNDKVWALDLSSDGTTLVSGGADSKIVVWKDITTEIQEEKQEEEERNILLEQKLANHLRFKEYKEALDIALEMDKPRQALKVFISIIENDTRDVKSTGTLSTLQNYVMTWSADRIAQVLRYCREWNTRARNSYIAMAIINTLFTTFPANQLIAHESIPEILAGIIPYAERHFDRIDKLSESSYLLDFVLSAMGILFTDENEGDGKYATWAAASKLVLPESKEAATSEVKAKSVSTLVENDDDEVITVGESSFSDESD